MLQLFELDLTSLSETFFFCLLDFICVILMILYTKSKKNIYSIFGLVKSFNVVLNVKCKQGDHSKDMLEAIRNFPGIWDMDIFKDLWH